MKNIKKLAAIISLLAIVACKNVKESNEITSAKETDTTVLAKADGTAVADTIAKTPTEPPVEEQHINYTDSVDFAKYAVGPQERVKNAPIDWSSYPEARNFKTRIADAYKDAEVDFAGFYVTSIFGCGASCIMGFMVDVRDGKIYDLPLGEENSCFFAEDRASYNWMSRLFIAAVCKENLEDKKVYYKAYLWNEDKKAFEKIDQEKFLVKK